MWYVSPTKMGIDMSDMSEFPQKEYYVLAFFCCASFLDCYSTLLHVSSASSHAILFLSITKYTKCTLSYKEPEQLIKVFKAILWRKELSIESNGKDKLDSYSTINNSAFIMTMILELRIMFVAYKLCIVSKCFR